MTLPRSQRLGPLAILLCLLVARPLLAQLPDRPGGGAMPPVDPTGAPPLPGDQPPISTNPSISPEIVRDQTHRVLNRKPGPQLEGLAPIHLQVTAIGPRSVSLSWQPPVADPGIWNPGDPMGYRVYMAQGQGPHSGGGLVTGTTVTTDATLLPATTYSFKVSAVYPPEANLREGMSSAVTATLPPAGAPANLRASLSGQGRVVLSWDALPGSNGYRLFRNDTLRVDLTRDASSPISPFNPPPQQPMPTTFADSVGVGTHRYQIRAVYRESHAQDAAETVSAPAPTPPVSVTLKGPRPANPALAGTPPSSARYARFNPAVHGFRFINSFRNSFIGPPVNMHTSGLCGGMSYAVLDYFNAGRAIPDQDYMPANNTTLQRYLYGRQVTSLMENLDKWAETSFNPGGSRNAEFFNWGLTARLRELMSFIDRGVAVPVGLKGTGGGIDHDHQALAVGYDLGRYRVDLGDYQTDVKIFLLDPNYPARIVTLVPDPKTLMYYLVEEPKNRWRTYFVDGKYQPMTPPNIANPSYPKDGLVHELRFVVTTGADDMRGGADHVDATVKLTNNTSLSFQNISQDGIWVPHYTETAVVVLPQPIPVALFKTIEITTNATGGLNGDNWDLERLYVRAIGGGFVRDLLDPAAGPFRFTGARVPLVAVVR
jgi:hypothetical protein